MAEIILPPEENEETPQVPELNIDKPTENSKVITIEFEAKKTNKVSTKDTNQQLYTTDTDAWFEFKETSLEGANGTYSVVFINRHDGSIFQRAGDVVNGVAYYKISHQEIRHAGAWRGQVVYTLSNGDTTAREFGYDVKGHILDGKDVREIVVEDFETLMGQLNSMKDNAELELADLVNAAERNELERQQFYESLVEDINDLQENYQELLDTGVLQTNINTKLEALEEEYAPKLTEVTAQLAQTDNEVRRKRELEDLSPTVLNAIEQGGGTSFNLLSIPQDGSATTDKTTFAKQRKNKFNGEYHNIRLSGSGTLTVVEGGRSAIVKVQPSTKYQITRSSVTDFFRVGAFESRPEVNMTTTRVTERPNGLTIEFETLENEHYLLVYVSSPSENKPPSQLQVEKGDSPTTYEPPNTNIVINLADESLPPINIDKLSFSKPSLNLFSGEYVKGGLSGNSPHNVLAEFGNSHYTLVEVEPNTNYVISKSSDTQALTVGTFSEVPTVGMAAIQYVQTFGDELVVETGSNENWLLIVPMASSDSEPPMELQIEKGQFVTPFKAPHVIPKSFIENDDDDESGSVKYILEGDDHTDYIPMGEFIQENGSTHRTYENIYSQYDNLMTTYPEYISKEKKGETILGTPIYAYTLSMDKPKYSIFPKPKIYINGGTHGSEPSAVFGTLRFMKDLCERWEEQGSLRFIKTNVDIIFVPLLNPDGFNSITRVNGNGVDLNRNFPTDWEEKHEPGSSNYQGPFPASEVGTEVMMNILAENPDLYFFIDYHNYNHLTTSDDLLWVGADDLITKQVMASYAQYSDLRIKQLFPHLQEFPHSLTKVLDRGNGGTYGGGTGRYVESIGIKGVTLESVTGIGVPAENSNPEDTQILNAEVIGNFVLTVMRAIEHLA